MKAFIHSILFGKYEILSTLGNGSFGSVYLSRHKFLECYRAIKRLPKQSRDRDTLLNEAQLLKSLSHPGIPTIYDFEEDDDFFYLIEEYVEGESLEEFLLHQSQISLHTFWDISLQLCDIFLYLHTLKPSPILYLDLKPEHIIVCGMKVKLIDFNVATYLSNLGNICNLFGNEDFCAPELLSGSLPNLLTDIYSIGKVMDYLSDYLDTSPSPKIQQIITKATEADPTRRYETVDELVSAINQTKSLLHQSHLCKEIAIVGSHSGCGATHFAISLVSTLNYMGYSAIYFDKTGKSRLQELHSHLPFLKEDQGMLIYKYFKGYPLYGNGILLPKPEQSILVYDYDSNFSPKSTNIELIIFVCDNSIWHRQHAFEKGDTLLSYKDHLRIICNMGQRKTLHVLSKHFSFPVFSYPYDENPFCVNKKKCALFSKLLHLKRRTSLFFHLKNMFTQRP